MNLTRLHHPMEPRFCFCGIILPHTPRPASIPPAKPSFQKEVQAPSPRKPTPAVGKWTRGKKNVILVRKLLFAAEEIVILGRGNICNEPGMLFPPPRNALAGQKKYKLGWELHFPASDNIKVGPGIHKVGPGIYKVGPVNTKVRAEYAKCFSELLFPGARM